MKPSKLNTSTRFIFYTIETVISVAVVVILCIVAIFMESAHDVDTRINGTHNYSVSLLPSIPLADSLPTPKDTVATTERSRTQQIAIGASIIRGVRKSIDDECAAKLAGILYDESEYHSSVDYAFLLAIIETESKFNKDVVSPAGAVGLGQLMPRTAESIAKKSGIAFDAALLKDPAYNVKLSVRYLIRLNKVFHDHILVAAAYNGGPGGARKYKRWIDGEADRNVVHKETLSYVDKVMTRYNSYKMLLQ